MGRASLKGQPSGSFLKRRLLKLQVGFLLSAGPGTYREIPIAFPQRLQVDDDLYLDALAGALTLTRISEGILMQGSLRVSHLQECDRCLDAFVNIFDVTLAELFTSPPDADKSVFFVDGDGAIDLAPLLREEILIETSYRSVCAEDCRGLDAVTGHNLNREGTSQELLSAVPESPGIDPRLAVLKQLLP